MPYSYCWVKKKLIRDQNKISILNIQHFWLWPEQGANRTKDTANIWSRTRIKTAVSKDPVMAILGVILTTSGYPSGWVHLWGIRWKWEDAPLRWEDPCSIWVTFSLSKGQEKRKESSLFASLPLTSLESPVFHHIRTYFFRIPEYTKGQLRYRTCWTEELLDSGTFYW